jgi:hypothetical protein
MLGGLRVTRSDHTKKVKLARYSKDKNTYAVKFMKKYEIIKLKQVDHIQGKRENTISY